MNRFHAALSKGISDTNSAARTTELNMFWRTVNKLAPGVYIDLEDNLTESVARISNSLEQESWFSVQRAIDEKA
jgi:hypothetical protein